MEIAPNIPRDFSELVNAYQKKADIDITKLIKEDLPLELLKENSQNKASSLILKSILWLNIKMYKKLSLEEYMDERILYLHKLLIYDYFDFYQSYNSFCGVQLFSIARSLFDHSRIFILCLCDEKFLNYYFSEYDYTNDEEKKKRFYKKRGKNISKRLKEISADAKKLNSTDNFYAESSVFNLTTELYNELSDKLGEISHMTEVTYTKRLIPIDKNLSFAISKEWQLLKFNDCIIEYLIMTALVTEILFIGENININNSEKEVYNFLNYISEELYKFRNIDKLLEELKKQVMDIMAADKSESNIDNQTEC